MTSALVLEAVSSEEAVLLEGQDQFFHQHPCHPWMDTIIILLRHQLLEFPADQQIHQHLAKFPTLLRWTPWSRHQHHAGGSYSTCRLASITYGALLGLCVCNLATGHYTSFPTNELTSSRAVFVQPLGACCYRNK
eukprot:scaffold29032_cov152-Skeletonema_marinoi.AAC.2